MRATSLAGLATPVTGELAGGRHLKRLCLLGHEARTNAALGRLLGKTFYFDVPGTFEECLTLLCTRGRVHAFVVDAGCCEEAFTLLEFLSERQSTIPTFVFSASDDTVLARRLEQLGVKRVYRKPRDIWNLSEDIQRELGQTGCGVQLRTRTATRDVVARAIDFIAENLPRIQTAADVSRHVKVSREHLTRQFTKYTSCTLWDFVTVCRVEKARELLRESAMPVKEVSSRVGYTCLSSFFRAFAGHTGLTPNRYRKAARNSVVYAPARRPWATCSCAAALKPPEK
jgi:AraC-like DNA-binding protein